MSHVGADAPRIYEEGKKGDFLSEEPGTRVGVFPERETFGMILNVIMYLSIWRGRGVWIFGNCVRVDVQV